MKAVILAANSSQSDAERLRPARMPARLKESNLLEGRHCHYVAVLVHLLAQLGKLSIETYRRTVEFLYGRKRYRAL